MVGAYAGTVVEDKKAEVEGEVAMDANRRCGLDRREEGEITGAIGRRDLRIGSQDEDEGGMGGKQAE